MRGKEPSLVLYDGANKQIESINIEEYTSDASLIEEYLDQILIIKKNI